MSRDNCTLVPTDKLKEMQQRIAELERELAEAYCDVEEADRRLAAATESMRVLKADYAIQAAELSEQAKCNGMGSEREAALVARVGRLERENELYAAEMSAARDAGWYSAQELFDAYQRQSSELAAAQATIQQMREALQAMHDEKCDYMRRNNLGDPLRETVATELVLPALTLPADRTALDAMLAPLQKAVEIAKPVMEAYAAPARLGSFYDAIRQAAERSGE